MSTTLLRLIVSSSLTGAVMRGSEVVGAKTSFDKYISISLTKRQRFVPDYLLCI